MRLLLVLVLLAPVQAQGRRGRTPEPILLPFDLDRDSRISRKEMAAAMRHLDTDGDQKVSPRELVGPGQREFDRYDTNRDGFLDERELRRTESLLKSLRQPKAKLPDPDAAMPPVPVPRGNPITREKALLGKILFWEQQLSSNDTIACGTCHVPTFGGADPRAGRHPGHDRKLNTGDDGFGSPGIAGLDRELQPREIDGFGTGIQVTRRSSPSFFGSLYAPEQFWDGRAGDKLRDPIRRGVVLSSGASLESQVLFPILDEAEMSHAGRTWHDVTSKLSAVIPMARAKKLTPDILQAIAIDPTYPRLFERAFGDERITPVRVAMAIATYERTLVPDQTPFDAYIAGDKDAMNRDQVLGWRVFRQSNCAVCHPPPLFTDHTYRNIGLRPPHEDKGRGEVTGRKSDRGKFKVASLRNVGLRRRFMHHGKLTNLGAVLSHYRARTARFEENLDPLLARRTGPGPARRAMIDFLSIALTDPRAAKGVAPFDHPELGE
ncbi:MAG: cytochrome c peroxidase [Planctomycetota bacterium]|jgi:cytochrome c peroxidase